MAREIFLVLNKPVGPYREVWLTAFGIDQHGRRTEYKYRMYRPLWQKRKPMRRLRWRTIRGISVRTSHDS